MIEEAHELGILLRSGRTLMKVKKGASAEAVLEFCIKNSWGCYWKVITLSCENTRGVLLACLEYSFLLTGY
jgi:hypothetical protein